MSGTESIFAAHLFNLKVKACLLDSI